ncbi:MAG: cupin domain-containing protein [Methylobacteriaceae bacterium]|jgi:quercetin dioxygenase-like cupin family protein|nr:cupin domain-containing protein [Methylobacteriaceae bacterium]
MENSTVFERFNNGRLALPDAETAFADIPWSAHPVFRGVELKHIVPAAQTGGAFSFHLVRLAPGAVIGRHVHEQQLETHEVIGGSGTCLSNGASLEYQPGTVSILPKNSPHEVTAGADGLCLFAKFFPALC